MSVNAVGDALLAICLLIAIFAVIGITLELSVRVMRWVQRKGSK